MRRVVRVLVGAGAVLAVLFLGFLALVAWTFSGMKPLEDGAALPGGARVVADGFTSAVVLEAGEGKVALVDAGVDPAGTAVLAELGRRGLGADDVVAILLTHGHGDHVAGCPLFSNATTYAHRDELPLLRGEVRARSPVAPLVGRNDARCPNLVGLGDGDEVPLGPH